MEIWSQVYAPGQYILSTLVCAIPVVVLLGGLGYSGPARMPPLRSGCGGADRTVHPPDAGAYRRPGSVLRRCSRLPVCWIIFNLIFLYRTLTVSGTVHDPAGQHRRHHQRPPLAAGC